MADEEVTETTLTLPTPPKPQITIDELLARLPESVRPVAAEYGPALLAMAADEELWAWVRLLVEGNTKAAMDAVYAKMPNQELLAEAAKNLDAWDKANLHYANRLAVQREAALAVLRVLLMAALSMVGL